MLWCCGDGYRQARASAHCPTSERYLANVSSVPVLSPSTEALASGELTRTTALLFTRLVLFVQEQTEPRSSRLSSTLFIATVHFPKTFAALLAGSIPNSNRCT